MSKLDKTKQNLKSFQDFFNDSKNEPIINTIKELCFVGVVANLEDNPNGESFAYRAGRQDVWNSIQELLKIKIEKLERTENE